jgi:hypothetical protein
VTEQEKKAALSAIERYALRIANGIGHPMDIANANGIIEVVRKIKEAT